MSNYLFFLGHQPHISTAEIEAVFSAQNMHVQPEYKEKNLLKINTKKTIDPEILINTLGGTVKIAEQIENTGDAVESVINFIEMTQPDGKIQFALSGKDNKRLALTIKNKLKKAKRSVRYIEIKNTATILHNNLVGKQGDFTLLEEGVYVTRAIQPIEDFAERDFGRPGADSYSGMLPPKLARIMINLAQTNKNTVLLDPFCGSGTILMEAGIIGTEKVYGTDISPKAIKDTEKNLKWIKEAKNLTNFSYQLNIGDATNLKIIEKNSIDAIVSEPYMGKPLRGSENEQELRRQAEELANLYVAAFKQFHLVLKKDGTVIFIIPSFFYKNNQIFIDCAEKIKQIGFLPVPFSPKNIFLSYFRPGQKLARNIWRFKKA